MTPSLRLVSLEDGQVRFRYKDYADNNTWKLMQLSTDEFLRRFLLHVLPKRFVRIRHYGLLAGRNVPTKLARCQKLLHCSATQPGPAPQSYDLACEHEYQMRQRLIRLAREDEQARRFEKVPGIGWIRATTFLAYVDTPWRFKSKSALWRYLDIGLERRHSGSGPVVLRGARHVNRTLKSTMLGAAISVIACSKNNPFVEQYRRWIAQAISPRNARRNVARSLAATLWGIWKSGNAYRPEWVGAAAASAATR